MKPRDPAIGVSLGMGKAEGFECGVKGSNRISN